MTLGQRMNINKPIFLIALSCTLSAYGQSDVTVEILDTDNTNEIAPAIQSAQTNQLEYHDDYVDCLSFLNPDNNTNVMAQWAVMNSLFHTNNIRIGVTMGSIGCSSSIHVDDIERARTILNMAVKDKLIDNGILKMKIEAQQSGPAYPPQGVGSADP